MATGRSSPTPTIRGRSTRPRGWSYTVLISTGLGSLSKVHSKGSHMAKERTPTSYLDDKWIASKGDDIEDSGLPQTQKMPPNPEWGLDGPKGSEGGYGHSEDVKATTVAKV